MEDLILYMVKNIVSKPDEVAIYQNVDKYTGKTIYEINVAEEDRPYLIGKKGSTINSIRRLASIKDSHSMIKIKE